MVLCKDCKRYFEHEHLGTKWHLCDMDCFVESISYYDEDIECDWFEHMDRDHTEN